MKMHENGQIEFTIDMLSLKITTVTMTEYTNTLYP